MRGTKGKGMREERKRKKGRQDEKEKRGEREGKRDKARETRSYLCARLAKFIYGTSAAHESLQLTV